MSTKFTDDEWLLIFQQRTQSGLSVRKWCDSNQISYDKYKYWEKKLLRRTDPERTVSPMDFVELTAINTTRNLKNLVFVGLVKKRDGTSISMIITGLVQNLLPCPIFGQNTVL